MALDPGVLLAPNFTAGELGADNPVIPAAALSNVRYILAPGLQRIRAVLGVPMIVTSGYRTPEHNSEISGSPTSDHPNGLAADFVAKGLTPYAAYTLLSQNMDRLGNFDQVIYYAADNHIHVGYGPRMRGQVLIKIGEKYDFINDTLAQQLGGFVADATQVAQKGADAINTAIESVTGERGTVTPKTLVLALAAFIVLAIFFRG